MAELPDKIHLTLVTRDKKILEEWVDEVVLPGQIGEFGVLPGHTPLLALLKVGDLSYKIGSKVSGVVISWGVAEVLPDRVIVVVEDAWSSDDAKFDEAERARIEAQHELAMLASYDDGFALSQGKLDHSVGASTTHHPK
jgi:F-type H+-transporting ATPase subunit epsilon